MLAPAKVKELLLHEDAEVRDEAAFYLEKHYDRSVATADDFWPAIDRYGAANCRRLLEALPSFSQSDESIARLVGFLKEANDSTFEAYLELIPALNVHYLHAHHDALLGNARLHRRLLLMLDTVRELYSLRPDLLWQRLMDRAKALPDVWDQAGFDECMMIARVIVDRGGDGWKAAVELLEGDRRDGWAEVFAIKIVGGFGRTEAIPALLPRLDLYDDFQAEAVTEALVAMADPVVVKTIREFDGNANEDFRFCAAEVLARYPLPESQQLLLEWAGDLEDAEHYGLSSDLCYYLRRQLPDEPEVIEFLKQHAEDAEEVVGLTEFGKDGLLLLGKMAGIEFPEASRWQRDISTRLSGRLKRMMNSRADWEESHPDEFDPKPITVAPKVGRNEPCPCGSGKKYKKCCLGKGPITASDNA